MTRATSSPDGPKVISAILLVSSDIDRFFGIFSPFGRSRGTPPPWDAAVNLTWQPSMWLRLRNRLDRLIYARHFKRAIDRVTEYHRCCRAAPQVSGNEHVRSGACAFWHNRIGRQFELNSSGVHAECCNAIEVNEGCQLVTARGYLNAWTSGTRFVRHDDSLLRLGKSRAYTLLRTLRRAIAESW
jgi:hypothetical protein